MYSIYYKTKGGKVVSKKCRNDESNKVKNSLLQRLKKREITFYQIKKIK